ncbi:MAG: sporulation protein YqfD, partial [Kiritimatiellia bacterium]
MNKAVAAGVTLHDTERLSAHIMVARVSVSAFRKLRGLSRSGHWRLSVLRRVGAPFLFFRLARRKGLVAGGLAGLLLLYLLSSIVWFVEIKGAEQVPRDRILALAAANGLKPGALKSTFTGDVVERQLLLTLDRLSWAYVEIRGTLVVIHVAEKVVPDRELTAPGDIVAAFDGVIEDVIVMRGVPTVQEGDIVRAGQVLISGLIPPTSSLHAEKLANGEAPYIKAEGVLRARVWHEGYAEAALVHREEAFTGKRTRQIRLTCGNRQWLWGTASAYATFTKSE